MQNNTTDVTVMEITEPSTSAQSTTDSKIAKHLGWLEHAESLCVINTSGGVEWCLHDAKEEEDDNTTDFYTEFNDKWRGYLTEEDLSSLKCEMASRILAVANVDGSPFQTVKDACYHYGWNDKANEYELELSLHLIKSSQFYYVINNTTNRESFDIFSNVNRAEALFDEYHDPTEQEILDLKDYNERYKNSWFAVSTVNAEMLGWTVHIVHDGTRDELIDIFNKKYGGQDRGIHNEFTRANGQFLNLDGLVNRYGVYETKKMIDWWEEALTYSSVFNKD